LNGLCTERCRDGGKFLPDPKPYGVNQYGVAIKIIYSDLDAVRRVMQLTQLSQSSFLSLQTPFSLTGLGRCSNYVEYLFMGVPYAKGTSYTTKWPGIIPNSQIVTIPFPPSNSEEWIIELFISPSGYTFWIILSVLVSVIIIGIGIIILNNKEKREDVEEQQQMYSFRAL